MLPPDFYNSQRHLNLHNNYFYYSSKRRTPCDYPITTIIPAGLSLRFITTTTSLTRSTILLLYQPTNHLAHYIYSFCSPAASINTSINPNLQQQQHHQHQHQQQPQPLNCTPFFTNVCTSITQLLLVPTALRTPSYSLFSFILWRHGG